MTELTFRPADADRDAAAIGAMQAAAFPFLLQSAATARHLLSTHRPKARALHLVAERDGEVVGFGTAKLETESAVPGSARGGLIVAENHRRQGIGTAILERLTSHWAEIGATTITGRGTSEAALAFAAVHGFTPSRVERISHAPLAGIPAMPAVPSGITVRFLSDLDSYRPLYDLDCAVTEDIPSDEPWETLEYDEWLQYMDDPRMYHEGTALAFDGDTPVALAWLERSGDRVWSGLTGTRREYRGRGLAKLVKTVALHRARDRGATDAYTNNDATNAPMLAVNDRLGYRLHVEQRTLVKTVA